ncbi:MAG: phage portal protein [Cetobacterium sp.]
MIITFQDFQAAGQDKTEFIMNAINTFKGSDFYNTAIDANNYYKGSNTTILKRRAMFYGENKVAQEDITKANNQVCNGFFTAIVDQANGYLLGNGVSLEENIKDKLGKRFDIKLQRAGINAQVQGAAWGYCFINKKGEFDVDMWSGTEFIPLFDEETNILRAGIRFWQISSSKPIYVELYEEDGITKYVFDKNNNGSIREGKKAYKVIRSKDALEETVIGESNWSILPIVPMYCNDSKKSIFTTGLKNALDLYDIILSDFGNNGSIREGKKAYKVIRSKDALEETVIGESNWSILPICT